MRLRLTALLASTLVFGLVLAAPADATFPGKNGKIAVGDCQAHDCGIFAMDADGTGKTQLTHNTRCQLGTAPLLGDENPSWSPDGQKIAYTSWIGDCGDEAPHIAVIGADGSGQTILGFGRYPAWSPDGKRVAFTDYDFREGGENIFIMNADGTEATQITTGRYPSVVPDWSPDGSQILFVKFIPGYFISNDRLYLMNPDGSNVHAIALPDDEAFDNEDPSWSPDGREIAVSRRPITGTRHSDVFKMNADGRGVTQLTATPEADENFPTWSPDGTKIIFERHGDVYAVNRDGSGRDLVGSGTWPDWQPIPEPQRGDYKNAAKFCEADRDFLGEESFSKKYGTNDNEANAYGKCVSQNH